MATSDPQHFDGVNSLDEANAAVLDNGMALRIQPPAPKATQYYYVHDAKGWVRQKAGHDIPKSVDVDAVRRAVKRAIPKNGNAGGGGVRAVNKEEI